MSLPPPQPPQSRSLSQLLLQHPPSQAAAAAAVPQESRNACHWFRINALRLDDNPALLAAIEYSSSSSSSSSAPSASAPTTTSASASHSGTAEPHNTLHNVFVLDPSDATIPSSGLPLVFLLESLTNLQSRLTWLGSHLTILRGQVEQVLPDYLSKHDISLVTYEESTPEPASSQVAQRLEQALHPLRIRQRLETSAFVTHTLYDMNMLLVACKNTPPLTYGKFLSLIESIGPPVAPLDAPHRLAERGPAGQTDAATGGIPSLAELGISEPHTPLMFHGGETAGQARMHHYLGDLARVANFSKPELDPTLFEEPSSSVMSPYLRFGCVSPRRFFFEINKVYIDSGVTPTQPPVSLLGQLYWREFFYLVAAGTPNFDRAAGNPICKQIQWDVNPEYLAAWESGRTGYPWIDAAMNQLREVGWMHHLARHAVACFLTRGDLFLSWELGRDYLQRTLLDADWSISNANWMWMSASAFFHAYFRVYSPITFAQHYDPEGKFVRRFVPALRNFPSEYIYMPWSAPLEVQREAGCIVGVDYPKPIVDHEQVCRTNMERMRDAYAQQPDAAALMAVSAVSMLTRQPHDAVTLAQMHGQSSGTLSIKSSDSISAPFFKPLDTSANGVADTSRLGDTTSVHSGSTDSIPRAHQKTASEEAARVTNDARRWSTTPVPVLSRDLGQILQQWHADMLQRAQAASQLVHHNHSDEAHRHASEAHHHALEPDSSTSLSSGSVTPPSQVGSAGTISNREVHFDPALHSMMATEVVGQLHPAVGLVADHLNAAISTRVTRRSSEAFGDSHAAAAAAAAASQPGSAKRSRASTPPSVETSTRCTSPRKR
ncbi:photolyase [Capsaspora owczarzaki ATCC 30864]|uniref:Photolyase n=1 Tax=Capsaspora owczarzaki (strain ATCC 30864) TaxID=595528 RepID=A0A0D2WIV3_CAPO3|nr:photolyase [Capsaspora owczarzaki ATCC 30864]KJE89855.1 photolyase [Capsaspora owczarzaki ATCC 30864]|eukprot:XP_004349794.2 photolyase [Capsaspora owczarzaki ATCC 30864]